jgi:hypothetical protein
MRRIMLAAVLVAVVGAAQAAQAIGEPWEVAAAAGTGSKMAKPAKPTKVRFAAVMVKDHEVLRLADTPDLTSEERAQKLQERLRIALEPEKGQAFKQVEATDVTVVTVGDQPVIKLRNGNIIAVTPQDAKMAGKSQQDLAQEWATALRAALKDVKVAKGQQLPEDLVTIAKGQIEMPKQEAGTKPSGGGAGTGTKPEEKNQK